MLAAFFDGLGYRLAINGSFLYVVDKRQEPLVPELQYRLSLGVPQLDTCIRAFTALRSRGAAADDVLEVQAFFEALGYLLDIDAGYTYLVANDEQRLRPDVKYQLALSAAPLDVLVNGLTEMKGRIIATMNLIEESVAA